MKGEHRVELPRDQAADPTATWEERMRSEKDTPYIWTIVELFYRSRQLYFRQYDRYETLVSEYVEKFGIPRNKIRLGPIELSQLLRFKELERTRDEYLLPLKDATHALFRDEDRTDFLDRLVNDLFHEISILKEEHYNVLTYSPDGEESLDHEELNAILDEVHEMFPIKVHRLKHLFENAVLRLEKILPRYRENTVLIRSLYWHKDDDFIAQSHPDGLHHFYSLMYGQDCVVEGYVAVADSFYHSGFYEQALDCFQLSEDYLGTLPETEDEPLQQSRAKTRDHVARYMKLCRDRLAWLEDE